MNKNSGVRPIRIGKVLRRIIGKTIGWVLKDDILEVAGPLETASGPQGGVKAVKQSKKAIFEDDETEAVIL